MNEFQIRLKIARKEKKLSQQALADAVGVTRPAVTQWETNPDIEIAGKNLLRLCDVLGVTPEWLFGKTDRNDSLMTKESPAIYGNISAYPRPIKAFEDDEALSEDEIEVPRLTLKLSCGTGHLQWEIDEVGQKNRFRKSWCARRGLKPENLVTITVTGDSMEPSIPDRASVTLDITDTNIKHGQVYAVSYQSEFFLKRVFKQPNGGLILRSDNQTKNHPDITIDNEQLDSVRILGAPKSVTFDW